MKRKLVKALAVAIVVAVPIVWASAQQSPGRLDSRRQSSRYSNRSRSAGPTRFQGGSGSGSYTYRAQPLPSQFGVLLKQTLFAKDHSILQVEDRRPTTRPASKLVLRGVMREGARFLASIEDTGSPRTTWFTEGQSVRSSGKIEQITLDHIVISRGGSQKMIQIGDSLDAGAIIPTQPTEATASAKQ
jgi:hypothetical protein